MKNRLFTTLNWLGRTAIAGTCLAISVTNAHAQVSSYAFAQSAGTYTPISGGTVLGTTSNDEEVFNNSTSGASAPVSATGFPIGFTFNYNGQNFDKFAVATNGYIVLGTGTFSIDNSTTGVVANSTTGGFANLISGFNQDLQGQTGAELSYLTSGSAPNRVLTVQWKGYKRWIGTNPMNYNFQIRLKETSNTVEVVYGTMSTVSSYNAQVGLRGSSNADYNIRTSTSSWSASTAGASNSATITLSSTVFPASGQTYTWTQPSCLGPSGLAVGSITTATASLSWTAPSPAPASGYQYEVRSSGAAGSGAAGLAASGTTAAGVTTAAVSGLAPGTAYSVYLRSDCGASVYSGWSSAVVFTTQCVPVTAIPWTENFDGLATVGSSNFPTCWLKENGDWATSNGTTYNTAYSGANYLTDAWTATDEYMWLPAFQLTAGTSYDLSFYVQGDGYTGWNIDVFRNATQSSAGATQMGSTYSPAGTGSASIQPYNKLTYTFTPATSGVYYFAVRVNQSSSAPWYVAFDDFRLELTPACAAPTSISASSVTGTGATISWTASVSAPSSGYQYEVRSSGAAGSGATGLAASGSVGAGVTTANVSGLSATTTYSIYVRSNCGSGFSSWGAGSFVTPLDCAAATVISGCGVSQSYSLIGNGGYQMSTANPAGPYTTPGKEVLYSFTAPATGTYTVSLSGTNSAYADYFFRTAATGCGVDGWTYLDDINWNDTFFTVSLTAGTTYLFMADMEDATVTTAQTLTFICPPTCGAPTNLAAASITTGSASLGWTPSSIGTPALWQISYGAGIATPAAGTVVNTGANPYPLGSLNPNTGYTFFVRAICGPGDTSTWSGGGSFTTDCLPTALPYTEGFASYLPSCWKESTGFLNASSTLSGSSSSWTNDDYLNVAANGMSAKINLYDLGKNDWLISPTFDLGSTPGNYVLEFDAGFVAYAGTTPTGLGSDDTLAVVLSTDNGVTWSTANVLARWTAANTPLNTSSGGDRFYIPLNNVSGLVKIGFYGSEGVVNDAPDVDVYIDSVRVTVCNKPAAVLGNDTTLCAGATLSLSSGAAATYTWSTGAATSSISVNTPGTYWVKAATANPGCFATDTIVVTGAVAPTVALGNDTSVCPGVSLQLNAGNPGASYSWSTGAVTQTISAGTAGTYRVAVTNSANCTGRDTIVISNLAVPSFSLGNDTALCSGGQFTLTAPAGNTYNWSTGSNAQSITVSSIGTYWVMVTNPSNCSKVDTLVLNAGVLPTAALGNDTTFCQGNSLVLNGGSANAYSWSTGATTQTITAAATGNYIVTLKNPGAGCQDADTIAVTVSPLPVAGTIAATNSNPTFGFTANGAQNVSSYAWTFGDGTNGSGASVSHTYTANGTYTVTLTVTNSCGTATATTTVTVSGIGVGQVSIHPEELILYPNPAAGRVTVENLSALKMQGITVLNAMGAVVSRKEGVNGSKEHLDISHLAPGVYTVRIQTDRGVVIRQLQVMNR